MGIKKRILIIHPEGNIFNNPNLLSIANFLHEDYNVDVLIPYSKHQENSSFNIISYNKVWNKIFSRINKYWLYKIFLLFLFRLSKLQKYDFIFGIDKIGIINAHFFSKIYNCAYSLISYEIFFEDETSVLFKEIEIFSCKNIAFAIIQDHIRGELLSHENKISCDKLIYIPVSSDGKSKFTPKSFTLHKMFNLPFSAKILIFTGSVADWTCISEILTASGSFLINDWVLVIHDRYGNAKSNINKLNLNHLLNEKIYLIDSTIFNFDELDLILSDADLGIVSYKPIPTSPYTGKNILYIGMSSGKFSTYIKNCLPVLVYRSEDLGAEVLNHDLGLFIRDLNTLKQHLIEFKGRSAYRNQCELYFNTKLSFDNYKVLLKGKINDHIS